MAGKLSGGARAQIVGRPEERQPIAKAVCARAGRKACDGQAEAPRPRGTATPTREVRATEKKKQCLIRRAGAAQ